MGLSIALACAVAFGAPAAAAQKSIDLAQNKTPAVRAQAPAVAPSKTVVLKTSTTRPATRTVPAKALTRPAAQPAAKPASKEPPAPTISGITQTERGYTITGRDFGSDAGKVVVIENGLTKLTGRAFDSFGPSKIVVLSKATGTVSVTVERDRVG